MSEHQEEGAFLAYVGDAGLHDASIVSYIQHGKELDVFLKREDGRPFRILFFDVQRLEVNRAEGMLIYALAELKGDGAHRRFSFVNWHEKDDARLEVVATEFRVLREP